MSAWPYVFGAVAIAGVGFIFYRISKMNDDNSSQEQARLAAQRAAAERIAAANPGTAVTYQRTPESVQDPNNPQVVNEAEIGVARVPRP